MRCLFALLGASTGVVAFSLQYCQDGFVRINRDGTFPPRAKGVEYVDVENVDMCLKYYFSRGKKSNLTGFKREGEDGEAEQPKDDGSDKSASEGSEGANNKEAGFCYMTLRY